MFTPDQEEKLKNYMMPSQEEHVDLDTLAQPKMEQSPMIADNSDQPRPNLISKTAQSLKNVFNFDSADAKPKTDTQDIPIDKGGIHMFDRSFQGAAGKKVVTAAQYSKSRNVTKLTYSDGSTEQKDGYVKP